jgi:hypothetical protein
MIKFPRITLPNLSTSLENCDGMHSLIAGHFSKNLGTHHDFIIINNIELDVLDFLNKEGFGLITTELEIGEEIFIPDFSFYEDPKNEKPLENFSRDYKDYTRLYLGKTNELTNRIDIIFDLYKSSDFWKVYVYFDPAIKKDVDILIETLCSKYRAKDNKSKVSLLIRDGQSTNFRQLKLIAPEVDIKLNYGLNFEKHHNNILTILEKRESGIFIFSGGPGQGKSFYIKYLTSIIDREFIYLPNDYVSAMESPDFLALLLKKKNAVIVLEDAEKVILSRGPDNNSLVASVLNLSDGILGSLLNITFIITYNNCKSLDIDPAILRKGRLKYQYEFNELSIQDAQNKVDSLKINYTVTKPMSLAEIYNLENDNNLEKTERRVGF